ncbi:unnamed protein product, partial [Didymodactylos carnosus]
MLARAIFVLGRIRHDLLTYHCRRIMALKDNEEYDVNNSYTLKAFIK